MQKEWRHVNSNRVAAMALFIFVVRILAKRGILDGIDGRNPNAKVNEVSFCILLPRLIPKQIDDPMYLFTTESTEICEKD